MAEENQNEETETSEEVEAVEVVATLQEENGTPEKVEENEATKNETTSEAEEDLSEDDDVVVTIGEDSPPEEVETKAPEWVKELRKSNREIAKENRELKEKLNATRATENKPVALGVKPTLEDSDYDTEVFESSLEKWYEQKKAYDEDQNKAQSKIKEQNEAWQANLENYGKAKNELKVKDFDDAEGVILDNLSDSQQGMILQGADNPALLVYALGKQPARAKEIALIKDPVKFAFAVAKLETQLKVSNRKKAPHPEKTVSGSAAISGSVDSTLDKLREEAAKSGDHSNVIAYKKKLKKQG